MERCVRFCGVGAALAGLSVLVGCGGGGDSSVPGAGTLTTQMLVVENNNVLTRDLSGANPKVIATSTAAPYSVVSPDGRTVVVPAINDTTHKFDVSLVDTQTGTSHLEFSGITQSSLAMSPDSMALAFIDSDLGVSPQVKTVDRLTGSTTKWGPAISDMIVGSGLAWDPLNRYIAVPRQENTTILLLSRSSATAPVVVGSGVLPTFSPNGSTVAYVTLDDKVALYSVGTKTTRILECSNKIETVAFARDGKSLLVTAIFPLKEGSWDSRIATMSLTTGAISFVDIAADAPQPQMVVGTIVK